MKISLNWVGDFVDISDLSAERIAELLSLHTAEVEGIETVGDAIADVVVAQVVSCDPHPDADKLSVTSVEYGAAEPAQVVCGASNVRKGLKIAFAPVKACLPGDFKIKKAKLRGVTSCGMICSERELELSEEHAGILELPDDAVVGTRLVDHLGLSDSVLDLDNKSLTHRPDLWGHYGFARELAAILNRELIPLPVLEAWPEGSTDLAIELADTQGCPAYFGLAVDLQDGPKAAPALIQERLLAIGQRPVNDLVDLTNYVLQEIGQPTHAFDLDKLSSSDIVVRLAKQGESLTTLDDENRELDARDLVIADKSAAIALAGVMGGAATEVGDSTTRILLESAVFHPVRTRRTSQRTALRSEASMRFEKSLDPNLAEQALRRFAYLLLNARPDARLHGAPASAGLAVAPETILALCPERTARLLGMDLSVSDVAQSLERLGFQVEPQGRLLSVQVPTWRSTKDVTTEVDLIEEVGRLQGYDQIQATPIQAPIVAPPRDPRRQLEHRLTQRLAGVHHCFESQSYSFLDDVWLERLSLPLSDFVVLDNPISDSMRLVRRDPVPSLLEQAHANLRERPSGQLFEFAKGYEPAVDGAAPIERRWLCVVAWAPVQKNESPLQSLFAHSRSMVEDVMATAGLSPHFEPADSVLAWAHPRLHMAARAHRGPEAARLGSFAALHPHLADDLGFDGYQVVVSLLDMSAIYEASKSAKPSFRSPSRLPGIKVDVALALPASLSYAEVEIEVRRAGGKLLDSLELFDLFEGGTLEPGQRSLAFRAVLRAPDRTLVEKDEQKFIKKVTQAAERLGGSLRG